MSGQPDAVALLEQMRGGELTALEVTEEAISAAGRHEHLGAFLQLDADTARNRAREVDARRARGEDPGPLAGLPVALKANLCLEGAETSCGSRVLAGYSAPYTATAVARLLQAGAIPLGMTNMDEFAMGSSSENSAFGPTRNPFDVERTPGGSSGGSAAAVAAGIVPLALGSDTGGSVRQPAAFCGVVGLKPTYGRVSRYGLVAFGSSLDQISPLARSVRDLELLLPVICGADERDSTTHEVDPPRPEPRADLSGLRIGVLDLDQLEEGAVDEETLGAFEASCETLTRLGATCVPVRTPSMGHALAIYYIVATAEASSNLARYDGVRYGARVEGTGSLESMMAATRGARLGEEVQRRILLGTYGLSAGYSEAWYRRAMKARRLLASEYSAAFEHCDLIASPTTPGPAFRLGERSDPLAMYASDVLTVPANLTGLPAISVPCGFTSETDGVPPLPLGLQLTGPELADARVLSVARLFQESTDHSRTPAEVQA